MCAVPRLFYSVIFSSTQSSTKHLLLLLQLHALLHSDCSNPTKSIVAIRRAPSARMLMLAPPRFHKRYCYYSIVMLFSPTSVPIVSLLSSYRSREESNAKYWSTNLHRRQCGQSLEPNTPRVVVQHLSSPSTAK
jgi:hypothetical protein